MPRLCRTLEKNLKADVALAEHPGATHAYDAVSKEPMKFPQAHCLLAEGEGGQIFNTRTSAPFALNDPCMEKGTTVAYDQAATDATTKAVKDLLTKLSSVALKN